MKSLIVVVLLLLSLFANAKISLTTSGGVSLGAYEGGFLYYSMYKMPESLKKKPIIFTGASAGAINSLLAGMTFCSDRIRENTNFRESLFWKMWMPLSFDNFTSFNNGQSLLDRSFMNPFLDSLENLWKQGLEKGCEFYIGVSLTRKSPFIFYPKIGQIYPRVYEPVAFKVKGRGAGFEPHVQNIYLNSGVQISVPFNIPKYNNFILIKKLLLASSSFPVAFPPEKLDYCFIESSKDSCRKKTIRSDLFIDGGVFNNSPLDIAYKISKIIPGEEKTIFHYLNPSIKKFPELNNSGNLEDDRKGLFKEFINFFQDFVTFSRVGKISTFLGEHPDLTENLVSVKTSLPLVSDSMYGFFGFFEQDFRKFDFYLGMLEARNLLEKNKIITKDEFLRLDKHWKMLECLNATVYNNSSIAEICIENINAITTKNFSALFQTSIDQLFHNCSQVDHQGSLYSPLCRGVSENKLKGTIFEEWNPKKAVRANETHTNYITRLLIENGFEFNDLELKKGQEQLAMIAIKNKIAKSVKGAREQQPPEHQFVLSQFLSPALNFIYYSPPLVKNHILAGGNMIDIHRSYIFYSKSLSGHYFRYGYGVNLNGVREIFQNNDFGIGILPNLSISYEIEKFSTELWQNEIGFRAGYQFSTKNNFKLGNCEISSDEREFSKCSDFISQFFYGLTFIEKARLQLIVNLIPFTRDTRNKFRNFEISLGWQF